LRCEIDLYQGHNYIQGQMVSGMVEPSSTYRLRALASEQRAREASDPAIKKEWEDLAIQWHLIAHIAAKLRGHIPRIDTA
jgi:hypothetical protein